MSEKNADNAWVHPELEDSGVEWLQQQLSGHDRGKPRPPGLGFRQRLDEPVGQKPELRVVDSPLVQAVGETAVKPSKAA